MATQTMYLRHRSVLAMTIAGMALTVIVMLVPFIDRATTTILADHIRDGYPVYEKAEIDNAVTAYLVIMATIGVLGLAGWLGTLWAVQRGKRWARWIAVSMLVIAVCIAMTGLTVRDTSGDVGLAPLFGWLLVLPCLPGLVVAVRTWKMAE